MDLLSFLLALVGIPYVWNGDSMYGLDCSGLATKVLRSYGVYSGPKLSAQEIFNLISKNGKWNDHRVGSFAFYGPDALHIDHVAVLVSSFQIIEARGGDSTVTTPEIARVKNAVVEITHINHRKDLLNVIRPPYTFEL